MARPEIVPGGGASESRLSAAPSPGLAGALAGPVRRHWLAILGLALAAGLLAGLVAESLEPVYQSSTTILVDPNRRSFTPVQGDAGGGGNSAISALTYLQTQVLLLQSRALAESVAERLGLWTHRELDPGQERTRRAHFPLDLSPLFSDWSFRSRTPPPVSEEDARRVVTDALAEGIEAQVIPDSEMIRVSFTAHDPALAAQVAAAYAAAYIELGLETRLESVTQAASWLTRRLEGLREQVEASELELQRFREQQGSVDMDLTNQALERLAGRLAEARAQREGLRSEYEQVRGLASLGSAELVSHPAVTRSPVIQTLKSEEVRAERLVSELGERYGPLHPKMVAAQSDLASVRAKLQAEIEDTVAGVKKKFDSAQARAQQLERELDQLKSRAQDVSQKALTLRSLKRDAESDRQLYDAFLARFNEIDLGAGVESANARVIDAAQVPSQPIGPPRLRIVAGSVFLALLFGVGLVALKERLDRSVKSAEDLERHARLAALGTVPLLNRRGRNRATPERTYLECPESDFAEAIRTLRTGVLLCGQDDRHRVLLVTSTVAGEGKTTVALNLAAALGRLERVLLVDANLRRPSIGAALRLPADAPGLSNLVAGTSSMDECIHGIGGGSLSVLPAGMPAPDPLEILSSGRFAQILGELQQRYERVVVDSAPVQAVSDALVLSRLCTAVVLVVKADATPRQLVQIVVERLHRADAPLMGAVLNQFDRAKAARYGNVGWGP